MIRFTDRAREVLVAAEHAARRFDPDARVRLRRDDDGVVAFELTNEVGPGDEVMDADGFELVVQKGLTGTVDAGDHNALMLQADESAS